ncbi:MAG: hypothetical protein CM1200mP30_31870 [Pseudomonadota bacterium]|nr:MAG: hypothetical protein CM1200mP30_31870 [Pseudomonadota bacterium]
MNRTKKTSELQKLDSQYFLHPFTDLKALQKKGARVITRAKVFIFGILMVKKSLTAWRVFGA